MTEAAVPPTDLKDTLEEMRASVAAAGTLARLDALVQKAILRLLEVILALLADFRAGKLARPAVEESAVDGAAASRSPVRTVAAWAAGGAGGADRAVAHPSRSRSHKGRGIVGLTDGDGGKSTQAPRVSASSASAAVEADLLIAALPMPAIILSLPKSAACAAAAGYARRSPRSPALRIRTGGAVEGADSKIGVFRELDSAESIVAG